MGCNDHVFGTVFVNFMMSIKYILVRIMFLCLSMLFQGPLIVTEELHCICFESELRQSGLEIKLGVSDLKYRDSGLHSHEVQQRSGLI